MFVIAHGRVPNRMEIGAELAGNSASGGIVGGRTSRARDEAAGGRPTHPGLKGNADA